MTRRQALMMRAAHLVWRVTRGMTLGVRGAAIDAQNRVCLVRHTYMPGWHLPGGGIEPGETALDAVTREFREETGIVLDPGVPPTLYGFYLNRIGAGRDHVALYVARAFTVPEPKRPDREIAETGFFPLDAPPPETTPATRARLAEIQNGLPPSPTW
ncbi:DNA mismatch repair protein MutT [Methylobacterium indicum]|uniref:NUDIX domain-containing protein n=1 Tax=Methylobacterium indicum TaxID=1775910 RepID=UPI000733F62B|nr:NUDIX domain-containing protein [Methylobacterium indicum]KTS25195.1 DNA mismatch repair protein MutT [Methylobacterium indicum]KTS42281.1 DNA mismatch repair protein MutT [Methylobacterium indicum]KTS51275.1 DNA mismatch repair protein MutT [Methylobacterium indicum]